MTDEANTHMVVAVNNLMISAKCVVCERPIQVNYYDERICERCENTNTPLYTQMDELDELRSAVQELRAELAKFHECEESNGCRDEFGRLHIVDIEDMSFVHNATGETMRTVYHKEGE